MIRLYNIFIILNYIYYIFSLKTMTSEDLILNNKTFLSIELCNNNGNVLISNISTFICDCDIGYFNSDCSLSGFNVWGKGWTSIQVIFGIIYGVYSIILLFYYIKQIRKEYGSILKRLIRLWSCPKYVILLNLIIACCSRFLYIIIDPFKLKGIFGRSIDRVLHELILSSTISVFFVLLLVWFGLFTAFDIDNDSSNDDKSHIHNYQKEEKGANQVSYKDKTKEFGRTFTKVVQNQIAAIKSIKVKKPSCLVHYNKFKNAVNYILLIIYPAQIVMSIFRSQRTFDYMIASIFYLVFGIFMIMFLSFFLYYTIRLKLVLTISYRNPENDSIELIKNTNKKPMQKHVSEVTKGDIQQFVSEVNKKENLKMIFGYIINPFQERGNLSQNEQRQEESKIEFEEEIMAIAYHEEDSSYNYSIQETNQENEYMNEKERENLKYNNDKETYSKKVVNDKKEERTNKKEMKKSSIRKQNETQLIENEKNKKNGYHITKNDILVLNKIFCLSIFIVSISILVLVLGVVLSYSVILSNPTGTIILIIFTFLFETICILAIILLFVGSVSNKEYGNLKVIGEIENYLKENHNKKIVFSNIDVSNAHVYNRLQTFLNIKEDKLKTLKGVFTKHEHDKENKFDNETITNIRKGTNVGNGIGNTIKDINYLSNQNLINTK